jgi:hypothetical protein
MSSRLAEHEKSKRFRLFDDIREKAKNIGFLGTNRLDDKPSVCPTPTPPIFPPPESDSLGRLFERKELAWTLISINLYSFIYVSIFRLCIPINISVSNRTRSLREVYEVFGCGFIFKSFQK